MEILEVEQGYIYNGVVINADTSLEQHLFTIHGCDSTVLTTFFVIPNATEDLLEQTNFEVFPNPTSGDFTVHFTLSQRNTISLKLLDVMGRTMSPSWSDVHFEAGEHLVKIMANEWPNGVYFVYFQTVTGMLVEKVVVN
ncbi:MAG: T9SS type A sorting domain-containing protein [Saprospiraceae bacterium]|nr:T9SS type A sorting domain-containing protein [Saprospiraceae bacterium]